METDCFFCHDVVSDWGDPICGGCYAQMKKEKENLEIQIQELKSRLASYETIT